MSNEELIASLGVDLDDSLVADLREQLAAIDEAQALEEEGETLKSTKLGLVGAGGYIVAKFQPGPIGRGPCHKTGTGGFYGKPLSHSLRGRYRLKVGRLTVELYRDGRKIWSGKGVQKGLSGEWEIQF